MVKSEGTMYIERRVAPRVSVVLKVTIERGKSKKKVAAQSGDISKSGIRICTLKKLNVGEKLKVTIDLEKEGKVTADCVVMWSADGGMLTKKIECQHIAGVKFTKLAKSQDSHLAKYIQTLIMG